MPPGEAIAGDGPMPRGDAPPQEDGTPTVERADDPPALLESEGPVASPQADGTEGAGERRPENGTGDRAPIVQEPAAGATTPLDQPQEAVPAPARTLGPLDQQLLALRDPIRRTMALYYRQMLNTRDHTPAELLAVARAFGVDTKVRQGAPNGSEVNAVTALCWNTPAAGRELLTVARGHLAARVGYGFQQQPSELLAVLAMARVSPEYPMRAGDQVGTVADLIEFEKLDCRSGSNLSMKLVGLSLYLDTDATWTNAAGETWSIERMVAEELARRPDETTAAAVDRLIGLSAAVNQRINDGKPVDGHFARAREHLREYQEYVFSLQNPEGDWHPRFLAARGGGAPPLDHLQSTARILQWLVISLRDEELEDPRVVRAVERVHTLLQQPQGQGPWNAANLSTRDLTSVYNAVHALLVYDQRVFVARELQSASR